VARAVVETLKTWRSEHFVGGRGVKRKAKYESKEEEFDKGENESKNGERKQRKTQ